MHIFTRPCSSALILVFILLSSCAVAEEAATIRAVPTFENCSIYIENTENTPDSLCLRYRKQGDVDWLTGHSLTNSPNDTTPRTSLFALESNTVYETQVTDAQGIVLAATTFRTWRDDVPIARTVRMKELSPTGEPVLIDQGGTPDGWVRYIGEDGYAIDGETLDTEAILIENVKYVILENLVVRGGQRHGIMIRKAQHIRIRNCDISGFGRLGKQDLSKDGKYYTKNGKYINYDAGIYVDLSGNTVIENCYIHDPRNHANSWFYSHPAGPTAIFMRATGGMVVRYNDLVGSDLHRWNDVLESYGNGRKTGGFNQDADIYGNFFAYPNDDGIELDGGQCNIRFYGNHIEGGLCGISTAANVRGPSFIFHNLVANLGDERGSVGSVVKNGGGSTYSKGMTYFYHNTFFTNGAGIAGVGFGRDKNRSMFRGVSRNNLLAVTGAGIRDPHAPAMCDYDYDLFARPSGEPGTYNIGRVMEANGRKAPAGFVDAQHGDFRLRADSAGRGAGTVVPGFSALQGTAPIDMGAYSGSRALPWRPLPVAAMPKQVFLDATPQTVGDAKQIVILKAGAMPKALAFRILKNKSSDWMHVQPETGTLAPNGNVALQVTLTEKATTRQGVLPGAFLVKFESGTSVPVTVYGILTPTNYRSLREVESGIGSKDFVLTPDKDASGGTCLDFQAKENRVLGDRGLDFVFDIPVKGEYYLYFRVKCPDPLGEHDSYFFSLNGSEPERRGISGSPSWCWISHTGKTPTLSLKAGENQIRMIPREPIYLDSVLLTARPLLMGETPEPLPEEAQKEE